MQRDSQWWKQWMMGLARYVATASKDPSTQVGAVVIDKNRIVRGVGYNGFPRGVDDSAHRLAEREVKYKFVVHAEANAILNSRGDVRGCTLITTMHPCSECAKLIIQAGIISVACPSPVERWQDDAKLARTMLSEAGVGLHEEP